MFGYVTASRLQKRRPGHKFGWRPLLPSHRKPLKDIACARDTTCFDGWRVSGELGEISVDPDFEVERCGELFVKSCRPQTVNGRRILNRDSAKSGHLGYFCLHRRRFLNQCGRITDTLRNDKLA